MTSYIKLESIAINHFRATNPKAEVLSYGFKKFGSSQFVEVEHINKKGKKFGTWVSFDHNEKPFITFTSK